MKVNSLFILSTALLFAGCVNEIVSNEQNGQEPQVNLVPVTFQAGSEEDSDADTKVTLGGVDNKSVLWTKDDQIKVFDKISNNLSAFTVSSGAGTTFAAISGSVSEGATGNFYAMYPYQAEATFTSGAEDWGNNEDGYITLEVPAEQKAVAGSLDPAAFIGIGQCTDGTRFNFKNATAFVKFQLNSADVDGLKTVSFSGNSLGTVAGKIKIGFNASGDVVQTYVSGAGAQYITLSKPDGGWKSGVDYYFAIRPLKFEDGFTITAKYSDNSCRHLTTTKGVTNTNGDAQFVNRNCTMNLGKLPAMKHGLPNDLYIAYLHGQDIDIAGNIVNKTKYSDATLVTADNATIANGLFFINTGINVTIKNVSQCIAIGRMADTKSIAQRTDSYIRLTPTESDDDYFMLKNISLNLAHKATSTYLTALAQNGTFEKIVFDECKLEIPSGKTQLISAAKARQINECVFNSCDIKISNTTNPIYIINYASNKTDSKENSTTMSSLTFHNNIVYAEADIKQFEIFYAKWAPITNLSVTNNIFYNTYCNSEGYVINNKTENFTLENNIFYMPNWGNYAQVTDDSGKVTYQWWGFLRCHGTGDTKNDGLIYYPAEGNATAQNNYCCKSELGNSFKTSFADMKSNNVYYNGVANPTNGTTDPFTTKDLTIPSFTLDNAYQKYIGATR